MGNTLTNETVSLRLPTQFVAYLRGIARQQSVVQGRDINYLDLIRDSLGDKYPSQAVWRGKSRLQMATDDAAATAVASNERAIRSIKGGI
jgi:hypothetical protein